jgi:RNA polymerase sigma factor FliA
VTVTAGARAARLSPEMAARVADLFPQARAIAWQQYQKAPHVLELDELTGIAVQGMVSAAMRWPLYCAERGYDPERWEYFGAYLSRRARGAILDYMRAADWLTRSARTRAKALRAAGQDLGAGEEELSARTGMTRQQVRSVLAAQARRPVSLDEDDTDLAGESSTEGSAVASAILAAAVAAFDSLDPVAQAVVSLRYYGALEPAEVAARLGISMGEYEAVHRQAVTAVRDAMAAEARG